jgi:hypothetical protein
MTSRYEALRALSERDSESIYRYAMARSKEIVYGLPRGSETSKPGKGKKMSLFEEIYNAEERGSGSKITEPSLDESLSYQVEITNNSIFQSKQKLGTVFCVEFTILRESGVDLPENLVPGQVKARKGSRYSWTQFPDSRWKDVIMSNIQEYCLAVLAAQGVSPSPEEIQAVADNKHNGAVLELEVRRKNGASGRDYFVHSWRPAAQAPVTVPDLPATPALTQESWLAGEGEGTEHPQNPAYEYHPDHPEWGVREKNDV